MIKKKLKLCRACGQIFGLFGIELIKIYLGRGPIPLVKVGAARLVVHVVKETMLRHQERVRLERSLQAAVGLHPLGCRCGGVTPTATVVTPAPAGQLDVMACLDNVGDLSLRVDLLAVPQDGHLVPRGAA